MQSLKNLFLCALTLVFVCSCKTQLMPMRNSEKCSGASDVCILGMRTFGTGDASKSKTIEIFLQNRSGKILTVDYLKIDGKVLRNAGMASSEDLRQFGFSQNHAEKTVDNHKDCAGVRWWQIYPSYSMQGGDVVSLQINSRKLPIGNNIEVGFKNGTSAFLKMPMLYSSQCHVHYIAFGADGKSAVAKWRGKCPVSVCINGQLADFVVLKRQNNSGTGGMDIILPFGIKTADSLFFEFKYSDGTCQQFLTRVLSGISLEAPYGDKDTVPLPQKINFEFGFDSVLSIHRLPFDVACIDARAGISGYSANDCLTERSKMFNRNPHLLSGMDFCTARYDDMWNIYAPMADVVYIKPYSIHWGRNKKRFIEEELDMVSRIVKNVFPRPVIWIPERFHGGGRALSGSEFEQLFLSNLLLGSRGMRCHHWINDEVDPFKNNISFKKSLSKSLALVNNHRHKFDKVIPYGVSYLHNGRLSVVESWCGEDGVLLLFRNLNCCKPEKYLYSEGEADVCYFYSIPEWLNPCSVEDLTGKRLVNWTKCGDVMRLTIGNIPTCRLIWIKNTKQMRREK